MRFCVQRRTIHRQAPRGGGERTLLPKEALPQKSGEHPTHHAQQYHFQGHCAAPVQAVCLHLATVEHTAMACPPETGDGANPHPTQGCPQGARLGGGGVGLFWILKLDLQKAFDSVAETRVADLSTRQKPGSGWPYYRRES